MLRTKSRDHREPARRGGPWAARLAASVAVAGAALGWMPAAQAASPYSTMAPAAQYLMADRQAEIALARTAAPPSVSADAEVLVLGPHGYVTAAPGKNGFVCLVERAWFSGLADDGFWNPKLRAPDCYNRQAARSVLPTFLTRTRWVMDGATRQQIAARTRAAMAAGRIGPPEVGSLNFMLSKLGYLGDQAGGPWHPHVMLFMPPEPTANWGANLAGTQVYGADAGVDPYTMVYIPVAAWSDGAPDARSAGRHAM